MADTIEIIQGTTTVVEVAATTGPQGPKGDKGDTGATGAQGPAGTGIETLTTKGDLLYRDTSVAARLPIGTSGQILKVAASGIPEWGAAPASGVSSVAGRSGDVTLAKADVGLGNVDNTSDANKPVSTATQTALDGKAASSHTHGNLTNDGKIGSTSGLPLKTGTAGVVEAGSFGTSAGTFCEGNDARLSDARTPSSTLAHAASHAAGASDELFNQSLDTTDTVQFGAVGIGAAASGKKLNILGSSDTSAQVVIKGAQWFGSVDGNQGVLYQGDVAGKIKVVALNSAFSEYKTLELVSNGDTFTFPLNGGKLALESDTGNAIAASYTGIGDNETFSDSVTIIADTAGTAGNNISLAFDGVDDVDTVLAAWNSANPSNTVTLDSGDGSQVPDNGDALTLSGGVDAIFAAKGSITTSGLTQATARILGRTTASAGSIEEISIGSGLSLSAGELSSTVSAGIPATLLDAKGDLIVASAADTAARLPVGATNGHVLTVDSAEATGMAWKAASGGVSSVDATTADVFSVSGSNLVADDGGLINSANPAVVWNDASGKLVYQNPLERPSGAGAMFIGLAPSTTSLGSNSVNIQTSRSAATQVASGSNAIAVGENTTASGGDCVAIGASAFAATDATALGGAANANASQCTAIGRGAGFSGRAAGSTFVGRNAWCSGVNGVALGNAVGDSLRAGFFTAPFSAVYWGGQTTNNTATILNLDATATNRFTIAANTALAVDILLVARRSDVADKWLVARRFLGIRRNGSNGTALIGSVQTLGTDQSEGSPSWTFTLSADDTNEALQLEVTGATSETVQWRATAFYRVV